ncbi:MAG: glycosyltransferase family 4 protein [Deltaproteobacteria bacterium]
MKIAFQMMGGDAWPVGLVYLRNLFYALRQTPAAGLTLALLASKEDRGASHFAESADADEVILYDAPPRKSPLWLANGAVRRMLARDILLERLFRRRGVDALFAPTILFGCPDVAALSWFPDFQHAHFPQMFSEAEGASRNKTFLKSAEASTRVILMCEAVKRDFAAFAPQYAQKARVIHPMTLIPESVYETQARSILGVYSLPERFIYLPNQFWKHKNHEIAFHAVKILKSRGVKVNLVCTGSPSDYRHPSYFPELSRKISEWNIREEAIYLGLVPREHVLLLMRESLAVLNPSLFEGWGYTVDEARSLGKRVILSDIPAHREQNPPKAEYFNPEDSEALADKLARIWAEASPGADLGLEREARLHQGARLAAYGETFLSVATEAVRQVRGG